MRSSSSREAMFMTESLQAQVMKAFSKLGVQTSASDKDAPTEADEEDIEWVEVNMAKVDTYHNRNRLCCQKCGFGCRVLRVAADHNVAGCLYRE